jgi:hypothetical protein
LEEAGLLVQPAEVLVARGGTAAESSPKPIKDIGAR